MFAMARSFFIALRASASVGRVSKLERQGMDAEAMEAARAGLSNLRRPFVNRLSPPEGAVLASLTAIIERLAHKTGSAGAEPVDLQDSLLFLRALGPADVASDDDLRSWIPYLESKLSQVSGDAARPNPSFKRTPDGAA